LAAEALLHEAGGLFAPRNALLPPGLLETTRLKVRRPTLQKGSIGIWHAHHTRQLSIALIQKLHLERSRRRGGTIILEILVECSRHVQFGIAPKEVALTRDLTCGVKVAGSSSPVAGRQYDPKTTCSDPSSDI
jgi:hypothetical protein